MSAAAIPSGVPADAPAEVPDDRAPAAGAAPRRIAVVGKGGTGKTTVAGTLARLLARRGRRVWAVDADTTPNLALTLGLPREEAERVEAMPRSLLEEGQDETGKRRLHLAISPEEVARRHGTPAPDHVMLLLLGKIRHAGAG